MFFRTLAAAFLALFATLCTPALAVTIAERSPFAQGHWWDPTRSGSGFELFNVGEQAMAIWYTFDDAGNPVWYTAQGTMVEPLWPILKHRWVNGSRGAYDVVGTLRFTLNSPESAQLSFTLNGRSGSWAIQPFIQSGVVNEVDHTGSYYNPANSGWGLTLTEQGDVLGGVLYTYDSAGAPTWVAGFDRGSQGTVNMISARGACPTCTYTGTTTQPAGRLTFEYEGEAAMVIRSQVTIPMAAGVNVGGTRVQQLGRPASTRRADRELAAFASEDSLKPYLDAGMLNVPPTSIGVDFAPAPAATTFSATNLQEAGVDEADLVKTDGNLIYTFDGNASGQFNAAIRVARVGTDGFALSPLGTVPVAVGTATDETSNVGLYLHGGQLVSVTGTRPFGYFPWSIWAYSSAWMRGTTNIEVFQTSPNGLPVSQWQARVDGHVISSRRIGDRLYVVSRFVPYVEGFVYGASAPATVAANVQRLASTPYSALMPAVRVNGGPPTPLVAASNVMLPPLGTRAPSADLVTVYAIDLPTRRIVQSLAVLGSAETVYASPDNLYIATSRYQYRTPGGILLPEPGFYTTDVHQVRLAADGMSVVGTGTVEGALGYEPDKAAFRLGEYEGKLRVVTSNSAMWGNNKNRLTILAPSAAIPGLLKTVSILPNAQRPQPLGKPGEQLYATRFVADRLYAVTFKNIDPLYVVDLSNTADPRIAGALEMPGYSEYLHPLENGLMLGFGRDARDAPSSGDGTFAWYQGLLLTLVDVSNPAQPRELQRMVLGKRGSTSPLLTNHHAFASLRRANGALAIAIPARIHDGPAPIYGTGDSAVYPFLESGLMQFELQGTTPASARLVQRPSLITHTGAVYGQNYFPDPSAQARAVLFQGASVYIGNGRFWRQDAAGGIVFGPF